jgi:site-specific DNA-adenine methylase
MKETILFGRLGNKQNDIKYFNDRLPMDIKNVVEPFGGTFAVSRIIYKDDKYNKFVNDNDENLQEIYKNPKGYSDFSIKMNNYAIKNVGDKLVNYNNFMNDIDNDKTINKNSSFYKYWESEKVIRGVMINRRKNINHESFLNICKKIKFSNLDYLEVIEKYRKNKDTFIFLDPPYLFSDNSSYSAQKRREGCDMTDIIVKIYEIFKNKTTKAKIMLIINDMKILRWLFKDFIKGDYDKLYSVGKRKDKHLIICNF